MRVFKIDEKESWIYKYVIEDMWFKIQNVFAEYLIFICAGKHIMKSRVKGEQT